MDPFVILMFIVFGVPAILWALLIYLAYKKNRELFVVLTLLSALVLIWLTWIMRIFPGAATYYEKNYFENLVGVRIAPEVIYSLDPSREMNGDGNSIYVHRLSPESYSIILANAALKKKYPIPPKYREHWTTKHWSDGPLSAEDASLFRFGLTVFPEPADEEQLRQLNARLQKIEQLLETGSYLYAVNCFMHGSGSIGNVDLFILSLDTKEIYIINRNT